MAKKQNGGSTNAFDAAMNERFTMPDSAKAVKGELAPQVPLDEGSIYTGFFIDMKVVPMKDQNSNEMKDVRVYTFKDLDEKRFAILGRTLLDVAFDKILDDPKIGSWQGLKNKVVRVERGEDTKLSRGRTIGNYDVFYWDHEE